MTFNERQYRDETPNEKVVTAFENLLIQKL